MCRKLRTTLPCTRQQLAPTLPDTSVFQARDARLKNCQKTNFDQRRGVRELSPLEPGDTVCLPDIEREAEVTAEVATHSYKVTSDNGSTRRNRQDLIHVPQGVEAGADPWPDLDTEEEVDTSKRPTQPERSTQPERPTQPEQLVSDPSQETRRSLRVRTQWVPFEPTW